MNSVARDLLGEVESTAAVLVRPDQGPPTPAGAGAQAGAGDGGEHPVRGAAPDPATPAGAARVLEGGEAGTGVRSGALLALTAAGEVVLHLHHRPLAGEVVLVDDSHRDIPGKESVRGT